MHALFTDLRRPCESRSVAVARALPVLLAVGCATVGAPLAGAYVEGRLVQRVGAADLPVLVWLPGEAQGGDSLRFGDVLATEAGPNVDRASVNTAFARRYVALFGDSLAAQADAALHASLGARRGVRPAALERRPLVVIVGALNSPASDHARIATRVAALGAVVVSMPSGIHAGAPALEPDVAGVQHQLADLRRTLATARTWPEVDANRIALVAWSTGGLAAAVAANEDPRAATFVSLDAATGYAYGDSLLDAVVGREWRWRTPHVQLEAGVTGPVATSSNFLSRGCGTRASRARVSGVRHRHFTTIYGALSPATDSATRDGIARWEAMTLDVLATELQLPSASPGSAESEALILPACTP